jgi:hypothetical protein
VSELRIHIQKSDIDLYTVTEQVWSKAKSGIHDAITTKDGHVGALAHSEAVEHNVYRLVPKSWLGTDLWRPIDAALLSIGAALHDAGKVKIETGSPDEPDHGKLSERRIRQRPGDFGLSQHQADIVGMLVGPHNNGNLKHLPVAGWALDPFGTIDIRRLAALLRLADMLHIAERVSNQVLSNIDESNKTMFRRCVSGWDVVYEPDGTLGIRICASVASWAEQSAVLAGVEITSRDLEPIAATLHYHGLPYRFVAPAINEDQIRWKEGKK